MNDPSVLILFAHPAFSRSKINRALVHAAHDVGGITIHDLYETYPDFLIDVPAEQRLLEQHQHIVLQHPFYWYSSPAIIKEWLDLVLTYGWAFGQSGTALHGKTLAHSISAGGAMEDYQRGGQNHFTIRELLAPFAQTARLCGMNYAQAHVVHDSNNLNDTELPICVQGYRHWLENLRDGNCRFWQTPSEHTE